MHLIQWPMIIISFSKYTKRIHGSGWFSNLCGGPQIELHVVHKMYQTNDGCTNKTEGHNGSHEYYF